MKSHLSSARIFMPLLVLLVSGLEEKKETPIDILQEKQLLIQYYNGPLTSQTLELFHNIEHLHIRKSNITTFQANLLHSLPKLKTLKITENEIHNVDFNTTGCCDQLEELELRESGLDDFQEQVLKKIGEFRGLKRLLIMSENLTTLHKDILVHPNLQKLAIVGCHLEEIEDGAFGKLKNLEVLDLVKNFIREIEKDTFINLEKVKVINLSANWLYKLTTDMIPPLPNLEFIILSHNVTPLRELNLKGIKMVAPKLKAVDILGTDFEKIESGGIELTKNGLGNTL